MTQASDRRTSRRELGRRPLQRRRTSLAPVLLSLALHGAGGWLWWQDLAALRLSVRGARDGAASQAFELELEAAPRPLRRPPERRPLLEPVVFSEPTLAEPWVARFAEAPLRDPAPPERAFDAPGPERVRPPRTEPVEAPVEPAAEPAPAEAPVETPPREPPLAAATPPVEPLPAEPAPEASEPSSAGGPPAASAARPARDNPAPRYPSLARRRGWEGRVVLTVQVDAAGRALSLAVATSSGHGVLDDAALAAVADWRFEPASEDGRPVPGEARVSVRFSLTDG